MYRKFLSFKLISAILVGVGCLLAVQVLAADCQPPEVITPTFNNSGDVSLNWKTVVGALQCEVEVYSKADPLTLVKSYKVPGNYSGITILSEELQCGDYNWQIRCQCCADKCDNCAMEVPDDQTWCEAVESSYPSECFCNDQDWETTPWKDRSQPEKYYHLTGRDMNGDGLQGKTADIIMGCGWYCMKSGGTFGEPKGCGRDYEIDCGTGPHQRLVSDTPSYDLCKVDDGYKVKYLEKYYINAAYERTKVLDTAKGKEYEWSCLDKSCFSCRRAECGTAHGKYYTKEEIAQISVSDLCVSPIEDPFGFLQEAYPLSELNIQDNKIVWNCVGSQRCAEAGSQDKFANKNAVNIAPAVVAIASWVYLEDGCKAKLASCGMANNNFYTEATFEKKSSEGLQLSDGTSTNDFLCANGGTPINQTLNLAENIDGTQLQQWSWNCSYPGGKQINNCTAYQVGCGLKARGAYTMTQDSFDYYINSSLSSIDDKFCFNGKTNDLLGTEGISLAPAYLAGPTAKDKNNNGSKDTWEWQCQDAEGGLTAVCALPKVDCELPPSGKYYVDWSEFYNAKPHCTNGTATGHVSRLMSGWGWECQDSLSMTIKCTAEQEACVEGPHKGAYSSWEDFLKVKDSTCTGDGDARTDCTNLCADPEEKVDVTLQIDKATGIGSWNWKCVGAGGIASLDCQADRLVCKNPPDQGSYAGWDGFNTAPVLCTNPNTGNWDTATSARCTGICSQEVDRDGDGDSDRVVVNKSADGQFTWTCGSDECSALEVGCQEPPDKKTDFKDDEFKATYLDGCSTKSGNTYTISDATCKAKLCKNAPVTSLTVTYDPVNYAWNWNCGPKACQAKEAGCGYPHKEYFTRDILEFGDWAHCVFCEQKNGAGDCLKYRWQAGAGCDKFFCKGGVTPTNIVEHSTYDYELGGTFDPEPRWTWDCGGSSCVAKITECGPPINNYNKYNGTNDVVSTYYTAHDTFVSWAQGGTFPLCLNGGEIVWSQEGIVKGDYGYSPNAKFYTYINQPNNYDYGYHTYPHDYNGQWMWQCKYIYENAKGETITKFFPTKNNNTMPVSYQQVPNSTATPNLSKYYCFFKEMGQCQDSYAPNTLTKDDLKTKTANKKGLGTLCKYGYVATAHPSELGGKTPLVPENYVNTLTCDADIGTCSWYCGSENRVDTGLDQLCGPVDILGCKTPPHKGEYTEDEFRDAGYLTNGAPCENGSTAPVTYNDATRQWTWNCQGDDCKADKICKPILNIGDDHNVCYLDIETYTANVTECTTYTYDGWTVDTDKVNIVTGCGVGDATCRVQGKSGAGQYTVTATITCNDTCVPANKKTVSDTVMVTMNEPKVTVKCPLNADGKEDCSICMNKGLSLTATPENCSSTPTITWYEGTTLLSANNPYSFLKNASGDYYIKAKIKCGQCEAFSTAKKVTVKPSGTLNGGITKEQNTMCIQETMSVAANVANCDGLASYSWTGTNSPYNQVSTTIGPRDTAGSYNFSVAVKCDSDTVCYKDAVFNATVDVKAPSVKMDKTYYEVCTGKDLTLSATGSDCSNPIYIWREGLNEITNGNTYIFNKDIEGEYQVTIGMTCADCLDSTTEWGGSPSQATVKVTPSKVLTVSAKAEPTANCAGSNIQLTADSNCDPTKASYEWFEDGASLGTGKTLPYKSDIPGTHNVIVRLTCTEDCLEDNIQTIDLDPPLAIEIKEVRALTATITGGSDTMCIKELNNFFTVETNACEGDTPDLSWEPSFWVDNPYGLTTQFTHDTAGLHELSVTATCANNNCCYDPNSANASRSVKVVDPTPTITSDKDEICGDGEDAAILSADTTCSNAGYQWYNPNLPIAGETTANYVFSSLIAGTYSFKAIVTCPDCLNDTKEWSSNVKDIVVKPQSNPQAYITGNDQTCVDTPLELTASVDAECINPVYTWYLDSVANEIAECAGQETCGVVVDDIPTCTAYHSVILAAKCEPGCLVDENISAFKAITVKDPEVSIVSDKDPICTAGETWETTANITSDGNMAGCCTSIDYSWEDNDGPLNQYSGLKNIGYTTDQSGLHTIKLITNCDNCEAEGTVAVTAQDPDDPELSVVAKDSAGTAKDPLIFCQQESFTLEATASKCSIDESSYTWAWPNGTTYSGGTLLVEAESLVPGDHDFKVQLTCNDFCMDDPEETVTVTIRDCECGPAHQENYTAATWASGNISDLCNEGGTPIPADPTLNLANRWEWSCKYGGYVKEGCFANLVDCGDAKDEYYTQESWETKLADYTDNGNMVPFCTAGDLAIDDPYCTGTPGDTNCRYTGFTNAWTWNCLDSKGDTVSCDAYKVGCGIADANMAADNGVGLYQDIYSGGVDDLNKEGSYNVLTELTATNRTWKRCTNPNGSNVISASTPENNNKGKWQWNCSYGSEIVSCEARKNCVDADNPPPCGDDGTCYETVEFRVIGDLQDSDAGRSLQCWTAEDVIAENGATKFNWQDAMEFDDPAACISRDLCDPEILLDRSGTCPDGWHVPSAQPYQGAWATLEYNLADSSCTSTSRLSNALDNDDEGLDCDGANSDLDGLRDWITFDAQPNTGSTSNNQGTDFWTSNYSNNGNDESYATDSETEDGETFEKGACIRDGGKKRCYKSPIYYQTSSDYTRVDRLYSNYNYSQDGRGYYYNNSWNKFVQHQHYLRCVRNNSSDYQSVIQPGDGDTDDGLSGGTPPPCVGFGCFKLLF